MSIGFDKSEVGSVGHLVGASLETAGHYMQGVMLSALDQGLGSSLATLLFTISAVAAMTAYVLTGGFRLWRWFLFGPILFYVLVGPRVESSGATWQLGDRRRTSEAVQSATQGVRPSSPGVSTAQKTVPVAYAFSLWNRLTSSVTRTLVEVVGATNNNTDLDFITRAERFDALFDAQISDQRLLSFINLTAVGKCSDYYALMREFYSPSTDDIRKTIIGGIIDERAKRVVATTSDLPSLVKDLGPRKELEKLASDTTIDSKTQTILRGLLSNEWPVESFNCEDLWAIAAVALRAHAALYLNSLVETMRSPELSKKEALESLKTKFDNKREDSLKNSVSHDENQKVLYIIHQIVGRMILSQFQRVNPSLIQGSAEKYAPVAPEYRELYLESLTGGLREMEKTESFVGKGDFLTAVLALPNVQGFILYWLAVSYPFFCLAVIVPGRHGAVFVWMGLWFWVKLWDVGLAVVMVIEKLLFALLPEPLPIDQETMFSSGKAIKAMLQVDHSYNQLLYYNLLATFIAAVPFITGMIVRRGGQQVVGYVGDRLTTYSGRVGYAMASHARSLLAQSFASQAHRNLRRVYDSAVDRASRQEDVQAALDVRNQARYESAILGPGGALADLGKTAVNATAQQRLNYASARINEEVAKALFTESQMPYNRRLAQRAIFQTYYNHDFVLKYDSTVGERQLEVMKARLAMKFGGVAQAAINAGTSKGLLGIFGLQVATSAAGLRTGVDGMQGVMPEVGEDPPPPFTPEELEERLRLREERERERER